MRILLIGRFGQVAWELQRSLLCLGEVIAVDRHSQPLRLDLAEPQSIAPVVAAVKPAVIINAAAYTAVDKAEQQPELAQRVNGDALSVLAQAAKRCQALLVHYSTDYVFDGLADKPYTENQTTAPQGAYGKSKLVGEQAIIDAGVRHLILRTAWVYGARGHNFLLTILRLLQSRDTLNVVADQIGAPTWSRQIALATSFILAQNSHNGQIELAGREGIYHLTCTDATSWFGFASEIARQARHLSLITREVSVLPIKTSEYPTPAKRPAYSVLSGDKLYSQFGLRLPTWQLALTHCLAEFPVPA